MSETIVLDPAAVATGRTSLDITSYVDADPGVDFGDAEITAYVADQQVGSSPVDYRLPNRHIKIPLNLRPVGATTFSSIRLSLQQKVGLFQREGGWIQRMVGATPLYADIVNASLHLGGSIFQANQSFDVDAVLSLECLPDWYGAEVTLDSASGPSLLSSVLLQGGGTAVIAGNYPGRCRIVVTDTSGNDQHGLLWGFRSRNYGNATTNQLSYQAEAMTPVNSASAGALAGASGGTAVTISSPPASTWVSMLSTQLTSGSAALTHTGSYRVWARCYSSNSAPSFRLQWGPSLSSPITNAAATVAGSAGFYALDLGSIRIDAPPVGTSQWQGVIQEFAPVASASVSVDRVWLQPLDESAGKLAYRPVTSAASITATSVAGAGADDAGTGTVAWANLGNVATAGTYATAQVAANTIATTHYLKATGFGFAIPAGSTILGATVSFPYWILIGGSATSAGFGWTLNLAKLTKAGAVTGSGTANSSLTNLHALDTLGTWSLGGSTDLWGTTLTTTDVNNAGFGLAFSVTMTTTITTGLTFEMGQPTMNIYYALASGFSIAQDAVVYANGTSELRTEGMYRGTAGVYAPISNVTGDLPRIPPSGMENRPVEVFVKTSRGNYDTETDPALDALTAQVKYKPSFLFVGA